MPRYPGGIIRATPVVPAASGASGVWRLDEAYTARGQGIWPSAGGIDSFTKLMLHMDGTDASTTFVDSSPSGNTITASGNAQVDTAQSKFGGASLLCDGSGDYVYAADSADWNLGTSDFTIDFWVRLNSLAANSALFGQTVDNSNRWGGVITSSGKLAFSVVSGGSVKADYYNFGTFTTATWYHVAIVRSGTTLTLYVDGSAATGTTGVAIGSNAVPDLGSIFRIGSYGNPSDYLNGWIDEFRLSNGVARWTSNFTPPSVPYD